MYRQLVFIFFFICLIFGCLSRDTRTGDSELRIRRFDVALFHFLNKEKDSTALSEYTDILNVLGDNVIHIGTTDSAGFYERLSSYFSEPTLMRLYADEQRQFADLTEVEAELLPTFEKLLQAFPELKLPQIYIHVSGLNQNVIVTDEVLSLSADKYLGADYPLYQDFFYDYRRRNMTASQVVPDYLLGYLMANLPYKGNQDVLLDRMLYEGKLRYILASLLLGRQPWEYTAYSEAQYSWCHKHHGRIWKSMLQNNHLYNPDYLITSKYMDEAPYTVLLPEESPGRIGVWIGYQIIMAYMKNHPDTSLQQLMELTDAQEFLKQAKYKP